MPSKKKARSQARKAKKEEARHQASSNSDIGGGSAASGGSSCRHIKLPESRRIEDFKDAWALFMDFNVKCEAHRTCVKNQVVSLEEKTVPRL
jgi:hypothetical protein